jgi:hypothetical protein
VKTPRPDLAALAVCVAIVAGMVALALAHVGIPDVFPYLATAALSAGAGVAVAGGAFTSSTPAPAPAPVLEQIPAQPSAPAAESIPAPFATHAP